MQCRHCGTRNHETARYCAKCGKLLQNPSDGPKRRRWILPVAVTITVVLLVGGIVCAAVLLPQRGNGPSASGGTGSEGSGTKPVVSLDVPSSIPSGYANRVRNEEDARRAASGLAQQLGYGNLASQLGKCRVQAVLDYTYYRFDQQCQGILIDGANAILQVDKEGRCLSFASDVSELHDVNTSPMTSAEAAASAALSGMEDARIVGAPHLAVLVHQTTSPTLVYVVNIGSGINQYRRMVSATTGDVLATESLTYAEDVGTLYKAEYGITLYDAKGKETDKKATSLEPKTGTDENGATYAFQKDDTGYYLVNQSGTRLDPDGSWEKGVRLTSNGQPVAEKAGLASVEVRDSFSNVLGPAVIDIQNLSPADDKTLELASNATAAYKFYDSMLKRRSFSGNGGNITLVANAKFLNSNGSDDSCNAFASCTSPYHTALMFGCKNSVALDTVAHEFTHSVEATISAMAYEGESGALKEATSDIFGELVEDYKDGRMDGSCDWIQTGSRNLADPQNSILDELDDGKEGNFAHPSKYMQDGLWGSTDPNAADHGHVHNNSTVVSHAAYLMCKGNLDGSALTTEDLARVLYATFPLLTSHSTMRYYAGTAEQQATRMLDAQKARRVEAAFEEVGIVTQFGAGTGNDSGSSQGGGSNSNVIPASASLRSIALVLDTSGSMLGNPMDQTKRAATSFVDTAMSNGAQVGLVSFDSQARALASMGMPSQSVKTAIAQLRADGETYMEGGLEEGSQLLDFSGQGRRIMVLMSDGDPTKGKTGEELVAYARSIRDPNEDGIDDVKIYAVGFNESASGQKLLAQMASEGCHYEIQDASDLEPFFADIADEINGTRFMYARVACPVNVTVTHNGETLSSAGDNPSTRTSFGSLTFEEQADSGSSNGDPVKVLRLREGESYDIAIEGYGTGVMDYRIGFVDKNGDYNDFRSFSHVQIEPTSRISTSAEVSDSTLMEIDNNGDGRVDKRLVAGKNEEAKPVNNAWVVILVLTVSGLAWLVALAAVVVRRLRRRQTIA